MFENKTIGFIMYISHVVSVFITALLFRNYGENEDFYSFKAIVEDLLSVLRIDARFKAVEIPYMHPTRTAEIVTDSGKVTQSCVLYSERTLTGVISWKSLSIKNDRGNSIREAAVINVLKRVEINDLLDAQGVGEGSFLDLKNIFT